MRSESNTQLAAALFLLIGSASCDSLAVEQSVSDPVLSITAPAPASVTAQHVMVRSLADGNVVKGSSATLKRRSNGLTVRVHTRQLDSRESVDLFWAIFNQPGACTNPNPLTGAPCSPPDLFVPEAEGSLHYVATLTAATDGRLTYSAELATGSSDGCVGDPFPCNTLTNPAGAEVHSPLFVPNGGPGRQAAQFLPR